MAELTGTALSTTFSVASDLADYLAETTAPRQQQNSEEEVGQEAEDASAETGRSPLNAFQAEASRANRDRSPSRDDDLGETLLRRGASRSRSSTPDKNPKKKKQIILFLNKK